MRLFFRRALLTLSFLTVLMPSVLALPASAANVQFHCWCRDDAGSAPTKICNHYTIDSGIADTDEPLVGSDLRDRLDARLTSIADQCAARCTADGGKTDIYFETTYRVDICRECNPSTTSSCSEEQSGRKAFGAEATKAAIAQCIDRQNETSLLPIHLAIPIGGIDQVNGLPDYINVAYRYMVTIVLVVAIVMVVYGGFRYLVGASMGDIQAGKKIIQDAIVGMLLVLGAYTILSTINPATTILSFKSPETINCQDLALPDVIKNARCSGDSECGAGKRCILAKNVIVSGDAIAAGAKAGIKGSMGSRYVGDDPGDTLLLRAMQSRDFSMTLYLTGTRIAGAVSGATVATVGQLVAAPIRVCSTGEQGSPCASQAARRIGDETIAGTEGSSSCKDASLTCIESWGMCWPTSASGNAPGMPCDEDAQCSNRNCEQVGDTTYKVCHQEVVNGMPCFVPEGSDTIYPIQCAGADSRTSGADFVCAYCPSATQVLPTRVWMPLTPSIPTIGQCKPSSIFTELTPCAP